MNTNAEHRTPNAEHRMNRTTLAIPRPARPTYTLTPAQARRAWLRAQRLDVREPFGAGSDATRAAVEHLGYVQIDTIHVIERCHHHILYTRIPAYERDHLRQAQSVDKTVFEYWTHALSYVPTRDLPFYLCEMKRYGQRLPHTWFGSVTRADLRRVVSRIRKGGPLTIRDIEDDELIEKHHPWMSRKPSKRALQVAFYAGLLTVSRRVGMLKTYELMDRHFGWPKRPRPAPQRAVRDYLLDRALRAQGLVSLDSVCHLDAKRKPTIRKLIETRVRRGQLVPVEVTGITAPPLWTSPDALDALPSAAPADDLVHLLSPFDPLVIQRKRLRAFFGYEHVFEAYVPKPKRRFGYFALPVLVGEDIVAAIDLKTDRDRGKLLVQQWTWVGQGSPRRHKRAIEEELHRFERFQLGR
jgi:uncharacterized protein YcaQ